MPRIGILGGTFNPPHLGHLAVARAALSELGLERLVMVPAHSSPFKHGRPDPGPERRLEMCRLLAAGADGVEVSDEEVRRAGTSYTVDTLRAIHASQPDAELTYVVGADTARSLPAWREPEAILELATLAVAAREGAQRAEVTEALAGLGPRPLRFLEMPAVDVSSSRVRESVARGQDVQGLVGPEVAQYIRSRGLYKEEEV